MGLRVKYPLFLSDFNETSDFLDRFFEKVHKQQMSWKCIQLYPIYVMRTDRKTDRRGEANRRFSQFCERVWKQLWSTVDSPTCDLLVTSASVKHLLELQICETLWLAFQIGYWQRAFVLKSDCKLQRFVFSKLWATCKQLLLVATFVYLFDTHPFMCTR
jgi:hypothetical protein